MRDTTGAVRAALAGAAVAALAMTGAGLALGQSGGSAAADGPPKPKETCRGPANGWQGGAQWPGKPSEECDD